MDAHKFQTQEIVLYPVKHNYRIKANDMYKAIFFRKINVAAGC